MDTNQKVAVKNRSNSVVIYSIPEMNIRRQYAPGETKRIAYDELEALTYRPGGLTLIKRALLIDDERIAKQIINGKIEPEYWLDEVGVKTLLEKGSLDEFLDCLDFAPAGVLELIKKFAVSLPLNDMKKRKALQDKLGYNIDAVLRHLEEAKADDEDTITESAPKRRTQPTVANSGRRSTPNYKVVTKNSSEGE